VHTSTMLQIGPSPNNAVGGYTPVDAKTVWLHKLGPPLQIECLAQAAELVHPTRCYRRLVLQGRSRTPAGVLHPVVRRRRTRRGQMLALLFVAASSVAAATFLVEHRTKGQKVATPAPLPSSVGQAGSARPRLRLSPLVPGPALIKQAPRPRVTAQAAIVVDSRSGRVLWSLHSHRRLPIASTTKIMTAVLALQRLHPRSVVAVDPSATRVPLAREGLRPHERVPAWKLFDGLLIYSGNDDALALAIATAGSRAAFVARMNDEARRLGLRDTHFTTPSGVIDTDNYSTVWDLASLTRYALRDPRFRRVVRRRIARVPWSPPTFEKVYVNKNRLLGTYPGADGVKTGWTTLAGHCLVASATRRPRTILVVLLHDANLYRDAATLLNLGFASPAMAR
jgi:D-alanyl-D-alanine carboxypeptidase